MKDKGAWRSWKAGEEKMKSAVKLSHGDLLDQGKIADAKRAIQELLASQEYIGARVEEVRAATVSPEAPKPEDQEASRWVNVEFHVDVGDKVIFGFRGNSVFTRGYLDAVIDELHGLVWERTMSVRSGVGWRMSTRQRVMIVLKLPR